MTRFSHARLAWLVALLCAVSLRLLTPPGWMPNLEGRGAPLVICTGEGVRTVGGDDDSSHGHSGPGHSGKAAHEVCAFAGFAAAPAPPAAAILAPQAAPPTLEAPLPSDQARLAPARRRPQAARAPPLST